MISFALTVARKDLLLTFTRGSGLVQGLLLGLLLLFVFSLSQGVGERMSPQGAGAGLPSPAGSLGPGGRSARAEPGTRRSLARGWVPLTSARAGSGPCAAAGCGCSC